MKKTKLVTGIILGMAALGLLAGCSSNSNKAAAKSEDALAKIKDAGKLVVATSPDFPPMEFYAVVDGKKKIVGSDISLAQAVADKIGVDLEIKATDFSGVLANIQSASVDIGISGFAQTKERAEVMDFSDGYDQDVSDEYQGLLVSKATAAKYTTLDAIKKAKLKIGAQGGSIQFEIAGELTDTANIKQYGTTDAAYLALNSGDIDAVTVSTGSAKPVLATFTDLTILPKETFNLDPDGYYSKNVMGLSKDVDNESLLKVINEVIKESHDSGDYEKWYNEAQELAKSAATEEK